jgi:hypothetical protein
VIDDVACLCLCVDKNKMIKINSLLINMIYVVFFLLQFKLSLSDDGEYLK